jgi:hypothetical protein
MDRGEPEVGPDAGRTWSGLLRSWSWTAAGAGSRKPVQLAVLLLLSSLLVNLPVRCYGFIFNEYFFVTEDLSKTIVLPQSSPQCIVSTYIAKKLKEL